MNLVNPFTEKCESILIKARSHYDFEYELFYFEYDLVLSLGFIFIKRAHGNFGSSLKWTVQKTKTGQSCIKLLATLDNVCHLKVTQRNPNLPELNQRGHGQGSVGRDESYWDGPP